MSHRFTVSGRVFAIKKQVRTTLSGDARESATVTIQMQHSDARMRYVAYYEVALSSRSLRKFEHLLKSGTALHIRGCCALGRPGKTGLPRVHFVANSVVPLEDETRLKLAQLDTLEPQLETDLSLQRTVQSLLARVSQGHKA